MEFRTFALCLLVCVARAQYGTEERIQIPCVSNEVCKTMDEAAQCIGNACLCLNSTNQYDHCEFKDSIVGSEKPKAISLSCNTDDDCYHISNTQCRPISANYENIKTCQCSAHMVMSANKTQCLKIALAPEADCSELVQCNAGLGNFSECVWGKCRCMNNYHFVAEAKERCVKNKGHMEKCSRDEQSCYQPSSDGTKNVMGCSSRGVCRCLKNYVFVDGLCQHSGSSQAIPVMLSMLLLVAAAISFF